MAKPRRATALRYRPGEDEAPRVVATGAGQVAQRIIDLAEEHGVPIQRDPVLVQALSMLDLHAEIPEQLYTAVAEVLIWAWQLDRQSGASPVP